MLGQTLDYLPRRPFGDFAVPWNREDESGAFPNLVAALTNQPDLHAILFGELSNLLDELCLLRHNSCLDSLDSLSSAY